VVNLNGASPIARLVPPAREVFEQFEGLRGPRGERVVVEDTYVDEMQMQLRGPPLEMTYVVACRGPAVDPDRAWPPVPRWRLSVTVDMRQLHNAPGSALGVVFDRLVAEARRQGMWRPAFRIGRR